LERKRDLAIYKGVSRNMSLPTVEEVRSRKYIILLVVLLSSILVSIIALDEYRTQRIANEFQYSLEYQGFSVNKNEWTLRMTQHKFPDGVIDFSFSAALWIVSIKNHTSHEYDPSIQIYRDGLVFYHQNRGNATLTMFNIREYITHYDWLWGAHPF